MIFDKKEDKSADKVVTEKKEKKSVSEKKKPKEFSFDFAEKFKRFGLSKLVVVLGIGILILLFLSEIMNGLGGSSSTKSTGSSKSKSTQNNQNNEQTDEYIGALENRLKQVLMKVEDIGQVEVMITVKSSKESVVLKDENSEDAKTEEEDSAGGSRKNSSTTKKDETVFQQSESGVSSPYVVKELEPQIEGILIIADGGNNEVVKSEIVAAVQVLFDVPAHKIKVMKMNE